MNRREWPKAQGLHCLGPGDRTCRGNSSCLLLPAAADIDPYLNFLVCGDYCSPYRPSALLLRVHGGCRLQVDAASALVRSVDQSMSKTPFAVQFMFAWLTKFSTSVRHVADSRSADDRIGVLDGMRCLPVHAARSAASAKTCACRAKRGVSNIFRVQVRARVQSSARTQAGSP